jgi:CheY-like chemotaxis protein
MAEREMQHQMILLVEDSQDDADLTIRAIRKNNIYNNVVHVRDGAEAIDFLLCSGEYAQRNPRDLPQVILLDLKLPKMDGLEVLRRIRSEKIIALIPVVVLTSSNEDRDIVESYRLGANSYIRKPVDFSSFLGAVRQLGLYWLFVNQNPPAV